MVHAPVPRRASVRTRARRALVLGSAVVSGALIATALAPAAYADTPQADGVILRTYDVGRAIGSVCELTPGQTPNVDKVMPNIDWQSDAQFGLSDYFITHALANINIPTDGDYQFRLTVDDNGSLYIGDRAVVSNAANGAKEGTVSLKAGRHQLRAEMYEDYWAQNLRVEWKKPGDANFSVIPGGVLTYDNETMAHVTAPGIKTCIGSDDTAGDGLPLDKINPAYDLVQLRAASWEPQVSALGWLDDETMIVTTWGGTNNGGRDDGNGEVFLVDGVTGDNVNADNVARTRIATKLNEPMGVTTVDGKIYISEKHQLIELSDADRDGTWTERKVADFEAGNNYHEFAFGLLYKDGFFYANMSVAIADGGGSTNPQPVPTRGLHAKISAATGKVDYVAGGLRTPNGIAWGPNDSILVTDNQGDWLPASKLMQMKDGAFYNHYNVPAGPFDDKPVERPIVWFPQNEIGNSPTTPVLLKEGQYAGQVLVGDVTYGGLQRVAMQEVEGQLQGAVFRHTQGLDTGVVRTILGPDGDIYVGGLGAGGNWRQPNKLRFGLQKLSPNGTNTFDMQSVKVTETGFDIEYTKPVSAETAAKLGNAYAVTQWSYKPANTYGGPKQNEEKLNVADAKLSADSKTVSITVPGLKEDRVVHIRSPRPFSAADGSALWSTETWYTANEIPGYVTPPVADRLVYEAEEATLVGGPGVATNHAGYSGNGFVDNVVKGSAIRLPVNVEAAGDYNVKVRYAAGNFPDNNNRTVSLAVNGTDKGQHLFPNTGSWTTWSTVTIPATLAAGSNMLNLKTTASDTGFINVDSVTLEPVADPTVSVEAETGARSGGAGASTEHAGYTGAGYVDGFTSTGATVDIPVTVSSAGKYTVNLRYAAGQYGANPNSRTVTVSANSGTGTQMTLPTAAAWTDYLSTPTTLDLTAGTNTIRYTVAPGDTGFINLDRIEVSPAVSQSRTFYEFEKGTRSNAELGTANGGYSGGGYVTGLDSGSAAGISVVVDKAGEYDLALRYSNGNSLSSTASGTVFVNGAQAGKISFPSTSANWSKWGTERVKVTLNAGANEIEYRSTAGDSGTVNLDTASVRPSGERVQLFDGANLDGWLNYGGTGAATWPVADGAMTTGSGDIRTTEGFRDFRLGIEFNLPQLPSNVTGQDRANSGIYLQERYEVQVLDSFGIQVPKNNDAGAIYNQKAPDANAATAPNTWQNYVIEFTAARWTNGAKVSNARLTAWWNGTKIHDNVEIPEPTLLGEMESPASGGIRLQDHGNAVKYRNVWVEAIEPAVSPEPTSSLVYEAERGVRSGGAGVATNHTGYSGTGFVDGFTNTGASLAFNVFVEEAGEYDATLRYSGGPYWANPNPRTVHFSVNGAAPSKVDLASTSAWNVWADNKNTVTLAKGKNVLVYQVAAGDTGFINLDLLTLAKKTAPVAFESTVSMRCVSGKVVMVPSAKNMDDEQLDISWTGVVGKKSYADVQPGKTVILAFNTRQATVPAGSVTFSATTDAGVTAEKKVDYAAKSCG